TFIDCAQLESLLGKRTGRPSRALRGGTASPVFFCPFDRVQAWYTALLYFAAVSIGHVTGITPVTGYICFGQAPNLKVLRLNKPHQHLGVLREIVNARKANTPLPLELNPHCSSCQYRARCLRNAIDDDSLSLISSMPPKERRKLQAKGITTITQLSYAYRP